jgi:hypothetical protein
VTLLDQFGPKNWKINLDKSLRRIKIDINNPATVKIITFGGQQKKKRSNEMKNRITLLTQSYLIFV